jgi:hypothetical protein
MLPWSGAGAELTERERVQIVNRNREWPHGPEGVPYDSNDGFRTSVWGTSCWHFLSCVARNFPVHPTDTQRIRYHNFLISLGHVLPCGICRDNFDSNMARTGYDPDVHLRDRQSFSRFVNSLHNNVNSMLGKDVYVSYQQHRATFEMFRAKCIKGDRGREGGCYGDVRQNDPRPTCLLQIMPEADADRIKTENGNRSMIVSASCRRPYGM